MPVAVTIRGSYKGYSGCDCTVRSFVRCLVAENVQVELIDLSEWGPLKLPEELQESWFDALAKPVASTATVHFCMPHQVVPRSSQRNLNFTMFEATRVPQAWIRHNRRHDLVIVPTESSQHAWVASGLPAERLRLCPLGVDLERFRPAIEPLPLTDGHGRPIVDYRCRFLNVSELIPRKNLLGLLRVWIKTTRPQDDALLILKITVPAPGVVFTFLRDLGLVEREIGKSRREAAPIVFLNTVLRDAEMPRLYATATHYWSMSCGEGWDQPMMEAAAAGLRLIAPDHSAYQAYLDETVATMIPARRVTATVPAGSGYERLFAHTEWWQPDENVAAARLAEAMTGSILAHRVARARMAAAFRWEHAARRLMEILDEVEAGC